MTARSVALLAPDEPPAVVEYRSRGRFAVPVGLRPCRAAHSAALGNLGLGEADLARHIGWDIGIDGVGRRLADRLDARLIMQPYSRLVIDCNRPPGSADLDCAEERSHRGPGQ